MTVKFENCVFRSNIVEYSVITNWGGRAMFDRSYFRGNKAGVSILCCYYCESTTVAPCRFSERSYRFILFSLSPCTFVTFPTSLITSIPCPDVDCDADEMLADYNEHERPVELSDR